MVSLPYPVGNMPSMARRSKKIDNADGRQMTLLDLLSCAQKEENEKMVQEGSENIQEPLRQALVRAIKQCPLSRWEIAGQMSHRLGVEVSKFQIDAWTAESKEGHRMPAEYLPTFCNVVGDHGPFMVMAGASGLYVMAGPEVLRAETQKLDEDIKRLQQEKRKREMFLKEMK